MCDMRTKLELAAAQVRQVVQPYRTTLNGPTAVRRIFRKQDEALEFARAFGPEMLVFSYESTSLGHGGQRLFLASGVESFFHYYRQMHTDNRCHYEVITTFRPAKLYLDLEYQLNENPHNDGQSAVNTFIKVICAAFDYFYLVNIDSSDAIVLDASTQKKFSQHVIFNSPKCVFECNLEQGQFVRLACHALWHLAHEQATPPIGCSCCIEHGKRFAEHISNEITPEEAANCLVRTHGVSTTICDVGVYTRNRNFRLAGSRKLTGGGVLWPRENCDGKAFDTVWPSCSDWAPTLISWIPYSDPVLLKRPLRDCQCCPAPRATPSQVHRPQSSSLLNDPVHFHQLAPTVRMFVTRIVNDWFARGKSKEDKCPPTEQWRIQCPSAHHFVIAVNRMRFCERVCREHRSNHVILLFDFVQGCYYQKCLDPDCRDRDFRSESLPIPRSICDEWQRDVAKDSCEDLTEFHNRTSTDDDLILGGILDAVDICFTEDF